MFSNYRVELSMSLSVLSVFLPTFFFVSITPGMCMTLALTLGMSIGIRRTLWMVAGELVGVGLVASLSAIGVAAIMLQYPTLFLVLKYGGGAYLIYLGIQLWLSKGKMAMNPEAEQRTYQSAGALASQGFVTAIANPKGWAFFIALLPPFIDYEQAIASQLIVLIAIILTLEFICLLIYAGGGKTLSRILVRTENVKIINRIAGTLMTGVGIWLALG
ncbi:lysine exporter protein LysE/YggA [Oleiphilus messinensis]|uniref:Lysine exporter protein LysE/YggA n=2 Tax=Oleiphilus messinensis TaxID=141451 RepID=A0A1Y0IHL5_9GAMM|nr:lysine exporter protein LysE/YggA [Oleiphilus messinensis]